MFKKFVEALHRNAEMITGALFLFIAIAGGYWLGYEVGHDDGYEQAMLTVTPPRVIRDEQIPLPPLPEMSSSVSGDETPALIDDTLKLIDDEMLAGLYERSARSQSVYERGWVARECNLPKHLVVLLAADENVSVRCDLVTNSALSAAMLAVMSHDNDYGVRRRVAAHATTPERVLNDLAADEHMLVRYGVAGNIHTPIAVLEKLTSDDNVTVRLLAKQTRDKVVNDAVEESQAPKLVKAETQLPDAD